MAELIDLGFLATPETIEAAVVSTAADAEQTAADVTAAEAARVAAVAAKNAAQAVGTTNDTLIAGRINDPASATATALTSTIVEVGGTAFRRPTAHIVPLMGQSLVSGRGTPYGAFSDPEHPRIFQYGSKVKTLRAASEPLDMHDTATGIGPGLQFARNWIADLPDEDIIVLVPAAHGGTPLVSGVSLAWRYGVAGNLTALALAQTQAARTAAIAAYPNHKVEYAAVLWGGGGTDAENSVLGATFRTEILALIAGVRSTLGVTDLPWISYAFAPEAMDGGTRAQIQGVQSYLPHEVPNTGFVMPVPLGYGMGDNLHINAEGYRKFWGQWTYDELRRIRGRRAATNPDLRVADPVPLPAVGATIWTDTFTRADATAQLTATETAGRTWERFASAPADNSYLGIASNNARPYRSGGAGTIYEVVDSGSANRWIEWDWSALTTPNVRQVFRFKSPGNYFTPYVTTTDLQLRRYIDGVLDTVVTVARPTTATDVTFLVLLHNGYVSVWEGGLTGTRLIDSLYLTTFADATKDGLSFLSTSNTVDTVRLDSLKVSAVA